MATATMGMGIGMVMRLLIGTGTGIAMGWELKQGQRQRRGTRDENGAWSRSRGGKRCGDGDEYELETRMGRNTDKDEDIDRIGDANGYGDRAGALVGPGGDRGLMGRAGCGELWPERG